ncbi:MAG: arginase family protein [Chloroflexi bacterium]|nr:arginase family protein [Chloroflexota bacterium]
MSRNVSRAERIYHVFGVPLRTGSLYPGNENDAQAYRAVQIISRLQASGCQVKDEGDIALPSYLPHHDVPPIKNWPGPRIAWDCVSQSITPFLQQRGHVPLLIGCDCSIVVGTTQALMGVAGRDVHILYVDGHGDSFPPQPDKCFSAATVGLWLITHASAFWAGPPIDPSQVTVLGWHDHNAPPAEEEGVRSFPLTLVRQKGPREIARQALQAIPDSASILLHFDIDVLNKGEMPAAYFPSPEGLNMAEAQELLSTILADSRIAVIEVSEYAALRDFEQTYVSSIVDLLATGLRTKE